MMLARIQTDVIAHAPDYCIVEGGGNDIRSAVSAATVQDNLTSIYTTLRNAGIEPIATTVLPATVDQGYDAVYIAVNDWLRTYCPANDIALCDWLPDITTDVDMVRLDTALASDQYHPNAAGAAVMGRYMGATLLDSF